VQISRSGATRLDLARLAERLKEVGDVTYNDFLLRLRVEEFDITVFRDARSIIRGTADPAVARTVYARYIGT
jgi:adenylyltransferase/sulfurtransferase